MLSLQDFIQKYTGQPSVGNTTENTGQCVGLIECWTDNLNLPHTWGNADQLMTNADTNSFDVIQNTPTGVPQAGDIICWSSAYNGTVGHTGIFVSGDANTFQCFEQNDPLGSTPHIKEYNYTDVQGWLHPKVALPTSNTVSVDSATFTNLVTKSTAYDTFVSSGYSSITDVTEKISDLQQKLQDCTTDDTSNWEIVVAVAQQLGVTPNTNDKHGTSATLIGAINALKNPTSPKVSIAVTTTQAPKTAQTPNTPTQQAKPTSKFSLLGLIKSLFGLK